jgi:predicted dehydrogenase
VRIGLIGAGVAGERQAAGLRVCKGVTLSGIADRDEKRAHGFAARFGVAVMSAEDVIANSDCVVVATPAGTHGSFGLQALEAGLHVLVERPIATERQVAREMIALAQARGLVLQVGHREEPLLNALGLSDQGPRHANPVRLFEAIRETPHREHALDVSVVLDLMVQDLFVAATLFAAPAVSVTAFKTGGRGAMIDAAEASIRFKGGGEAKLKASRTSAVRTTQWKVTFNQGSLSADFVRGTMDKKPSKSGVVPFPAMDRDPVAQTASAFVAACRGEIAPPNNEMALAALDLALHVETILKEKA